MLNFERSFEMGRRVDARKDTSFQNAVLALRKLEDAGEEPVYIEGYVFIDFTPQEPLISVFHGWLELPSGEIIDPTLWAYRKRLHWKAPRGYIYETENKFTSEFFTQVYRVVRELPIGYGYAPYKRAPACRA